MLRHATLLFVTCFMMLRVMADLAFTAPEIYPDIGLSLPIFVRATPDPVPAPLAQAFILTRGDTMLLEDRYDILDLWYATVVRARWTDPAGNRMLIAKLSHTLPVGTEDYLSRDAFNLLLQSDARLNPRKRAEVEACLELLTAGGIQPPVKCKINGFNLETVLRYPIANRPNELLYAFQPRRIGNSSTPPWYAILLTLNSTENSDVARATVETAVLEAISVPSKINQSDGVRAKGYDTPATLDVDTLDRRATRAGIINYPMWKYADIPGYTLLSDLDDTVGEAWLARMREDMPRLHAAYRAVLPGAIAPDALSVIRIFRLRDDYMRYVGADYAWSAALWHTQRRELILFQPPASRTDDIDGLMRNVQHEAFHQYLSYATCMLGASPWLNEGFAVLFENASFKKDGTLVYNPVAEYDALIRANRDAFTDAIPAFLLIDYPAFYDTENNDSATRSANYALAYALTKFITVGAPKLRGQPFSDIIPIYMRELLATHDYAAATRAALLNDSARLLKFQTAFREFWR